VIVVVDASIVADVLTDSSLRGRWARAATQDRTLASVSFIKVEALSVLRKLGFKGVSIEDAYGDLVAMPIETYPVERLLAQAWATRSNLTIYDGCYVALAIALDAPLLTCDQRIARAAEALHLPVQIITF
jgi:predicted nucleic acid-binding protein